MTPSSIIRRMTVNISPSVCHNWFWDPRNTSYLQPSSLLAEEPCSVWFVTWNSFYTFNYPFYSPVCLFQPYSLLNSSHPPRSHFWLAEESLQDGWGMLSGSGGDLKFPLAVSRLSGGWTLWCANCPDQRCGLSTPWPPSGPCILVSFARRKACVFWGRKEPEARPLLGLAWTWIWNMASVYIWS